MKKSGKELRNKLDNYIQKKYNTKAERCYFSSLDGCFNELSNSNGLECNLCDDYMPFSEGLKLRIQHYVGKGTSK